ncbi:hypothetical protein ACFYWY_38075 [Streptomyces sp. NPDC002870]
MNLRALRRHPSAAAAAAVGTLVLIAGVATPAAAGISEPSIA